ncbi:MAG: outer membrane protein assembly factor BamD [Candidatus Neomarinimicrobiota bacterium]|jgi:outer membrane protein assembly factor BamD|tara:strand:- start:1140 stop:1895 length:756 start_codon:yes stop_codon:yes gene_type:complete
MKLIPIPIVFSLFIAGCSITNPFDDNIPYKTRFDDGLAFYEDEKYVKASQQFNIIVERASHTDLGDDALFFLAESYFLNKDYDLALIEFEKLVSRMGFSPYIEKSRWRICESLMLLSPNYYHDQDSSIKAISQIQEFLDDFPNSEYSKDADKLIDQLRSRLAEKSMETGKLYVKLKAYDSAIVAYNIVVNEYYDTKFFEDANIEIIRCLSLQDKNNEAKQFLSDIEMNENLTFSDSFKGKALSIIENNSFN